MPATYTKGWSHPPLGLFNLADCLSKKEEAVYSAINLLKKEARPMRTDEILIGIGEGVDANGSPQERRNLGSSLSALAKRSQKIIKVSPGLYKYRSAEGKGRMTDIYQKKGPRNQTKPKIKAL